MLGKNKKRLPKLRDRDVLFVTTKGSKNPIPILGKDLKNLSNNEIEIEATFETISRNLSAYPYTLNYTSNILTSIVYTLPLGTITKTFNYTMGQLTSIVLSGDTPSGIDLTKTLNYTGNDLTSITYS